METIESITILGGMDKSGGREELELTIRSGEIACIVGPTGSGKSRLLADIECLAGGDSPTRRKVLVNGGLPGRELKKAYKNRLIAQLSQNMNFIMDISAMKFIMIHAQARMGQAGSCAARELADKVIACANGLSGESFLPETPVTQLSGGQSRALMIADTALLSPAPIALIDEIENAGIDRKKALELLVSREKIILMSTHDPILALSGHKRIVMQHGRIREVLEAAPEERSNLAALEQVDRRLTQLREAIRSGGRIAGDMKSYFSLEG
ncbi:MAG: putative bacteriocin export transporter, lactococcin group [Paenibacillaceae bacterium]|jgi:ABC-type lipoprotein export system ATPase subunit|nr:putative bacteriocin export transporter, lactococcin group [Paenibacillaceae bacterium]